MCYLVAKDRYAHGCFALKTTHGKHLAELKRELNRVVGYKGVQLVTINSIWRVCTVSFCGYRAGISDSCKRASFIGTSSACPRQKQTLVLWMSSRYRS